MLSRVHENGPKLTASILTVINKIGIELKLLHFDSGNAISKHSGLAQMIPLPEYLLLDRRHE